MNLRAHIYKFQFSHFEDVGGAASAMLHRMSPGLSYKQLYVQFFWQLCLFLLTLNVSASLYQAIEGQYVQEVDVVDVHNTREGIIKNFSATYNISSTDVQRLFNDVNSVRNVGDNRSLRYLEAFVLALSTFFTIGWGHVTPRSIGGKVFCMISSIIGIPLTVLAVSTAAKLVIRHVQDLIRVTQTNYTSKRNKYGDTKISTRTRSLLLPSLLLMLVAYWMLTSLAVMKLEGFSFIDALYYSFCTFSTIGFGDYVQDTMVKETDSGTAFSLVVFCFVWIFFGIVLVAANILTLYMYQKKPMRLRKKQKKAKIVDQQMVPLTETNA